MSEEVTSADALENLRESVNALRYRSGPWYDRGPMADKYHWPLSREDLFNVSHFALQFILSLERDDTTKQSEEVDGKLEQSVKQLIKACQKECDKFRFPDEDRPIIHAALKSFESEHPEFFTK